VDPGRKARAPHSVRDHRHVFLHSRVACPGPATRASQFFGKVFDDAVILLAMLDTALGSALALALAAGGAVGAAQAPVTERPKIEGAWTLNRDIGDRPGRSAGMPDDQGGGHRHGGYGGGGGGYGGGMGGMR